MEFKKVCAYHVIQPVSCKCVLCPKHRVEVMRIPVVPYEGKYSDPDISLERIPIEDAQVLLCIHGVVERLDEQGNA